MLLSLRGLTLLLFLTKMQQTSASPGTGVRLLDFRKMMKVFVRYNVKVDVVPYTSIFAFAMGFRGNWDIVPAKILHSMKKISQMKDIIVGQGNYQGDVYPATQYQRAVHSGLQRGFDLHGLNGSACLQRTLCEIRSINDDDVVSRIFKTILNSTEEEFSCTEDLPCPFSFVDFIDHILTGNIHVQN